MCTKKFQMYKLGLEKTEQPEIKLPTFIRSWRKQGNSRKKHLLLVDYDKAFDCVNHNKMWKILKEMGEPDHLTCLLRNLYAKQDAIARIRHGTTDCFIIGEGEQEGHVLSCCLFNLYTEYIMQNAGLDDSKAE